MTQAPLLTARGLVKRYGRVTALDHCDFDLMPGEILAVIGDNGAGKSTLIKAISGAVTPDAALAGLEAWLADARSSGVRAVGTFAAGLERDGAAVRAALATPWSNGQAEGQVTRLKLLKRQMYGRAGLDLLRHRTLLAA